MKSRSVRDWIPCFVTVVVTASCLFACRSAAPEGTAGDAFPPGDQPTPLEEDVELVSGQELSSLPFDRPGPYHLGLHQVTAIDERRGGRQIAISFWYPAVTAQDPDSYDAVIDAIPDPEGAPYPLILSSTKVATTFARYLVSRGFTWASIDGIDTYERWNEQMVAQPLDILFALDLAATDPPEALAGVIDVDRAGAIGYSFDGYNALSLSGVRVDPQFYLSSCSNPAIAREEATLILDQNYHCGPALQWEAFTASARDVYWTTADELWQPLSDDRIRAVMPLAAEGWWLFGERGLAATDRPALFLVGSRDELYQENLIIFDHLGSRDKGLITFIDRSHVMIFDRASIKKMAHFAAAFFGYYLQERTEMAWYFSEEFVEEQAGLAWGAFTNQ